MQILENQINYKCDHCGKKYFRKTDIVRHEKWCKKNPANKHKCFEFCQHLIKEREPIEGTGGYDQPEQTRCTFICGVTGAKMYSFIAERKKIVREDEARMPAECDLFKAPELVEY